MQRPQGLTAADARSALLRLVAHLPERVRPRSVRRLVDVLKEDTERVAAPVPPWLADL